MYGGWSWLHYDMESSPNGLVSQKFLNDMTVISADQLMTNLVYVQVASSFKFCLSNLVGEKQLLKAKQIMKMNGQMNGNQYFLLFFFSISFHLAGQQDEVNWKN